MKVIFRWLNTLGINLFQVVNSPRGLVAFFRDYIKFYFQNKNQGSSKIKVSLSYPCITDRFEQSGTAKGHYFHQDYYVAKKIFESNPIKHIDVASRVDGFVAHVAVFREIEVFDIRPLVSPLENIKFSQVDLMKPVEKTSYCDSLSCLHAIEHFGLGRYGDRVDAEGHIKGINGLKNILSPGGTLYFSVPIGGERVEFNAHRVFSTKSILEYFGSDFELVEFSYVDDEGNMHESVSFDNLDFESSYGLSYGCGIFTFRKN